MLMPTQEDKLRTEDLAEVALAQPQRSYAKEAIATYHSEERVLERLKISQGQLLDLLDHHAYVRLEGSRVNPEAEARLVWSPADKDFVLVWQNIYSGALITCMLFTGSRLEKRLLVHWGETSLNNACAKARRRFKQYLLKTSSSPELPPEPPADPADGEGSLLDWLEPASLKEPESTFKPLPEPVLELHMPYGNRHPLPLVLMPAAFVASHPVRTQKEAWHFLVDFLASDWAPGYLNAMLEATRWSLDQLNAVSLQLSRTNGSLFPRVYPDKPRMRYVKEDLEEGGRLYESVLVLDLSLHSPLGPEHPFFPVGDASGE